MGSHLISSRRMRSARSSLLSRSLPGGGGGGSASSSSSRAAPPAQQRPLSASPDPHRRHPQQALQAAWQWPSACCSTSMRWHCIKSRE